MAIESLSPAMATSRISRAMDVPRSSIYYRRTEGSGRGNLNAYAFSTALMQSLAVHVFENS